MKVTNNLGVESLTLHWHGMLLTGNPWMDGPAYVTQCPIPPGATFVYRFNAFPAGTHWYHAHLASQRLDGLYGMLVVHEDEPKQPERLITIQDWKHLDTVGILTSLPFSSPPGSGNVLVASPDRDRYVDGSTFAPRKIYSVIFNGRGRFDDTTGKTPLSEFTVRRGRKTRFRLVHTGSDLLLRISIDGHLIDMVASDGNELKLQHKVNYFVINPGETMDFEITPNGQPGPYWIRANTLQGDSSSGQIKGWNAVLRYENGNMASEPDTKDWDCTAASRCTLFNCPFGGYPDSSYTDCLHLTEAQSTANPQQTKYAYGLDDVGEAVDEYFLRFGFLGGPGINGRSYVKTSVPFSQRTDLMKQRVSCDSLACQGRPCRCTHIIPVQYDRTIQIVAFSNQGVHNLHLHGHNFAVIAEGYPTFNKTTGLAGGMNEDLTLSGLSGSWTSAPPSLGTMKPPIKDTVLIPRNGYVVIRFRSVNPGPWFLHCHHQFHHMGGMALVLDVAEERQPPPPHGFPTCGDFDWTQQDYDKYLMNYKMFSPPFPF